MDDNDEIPILAPDESDPEFVAFLSDRILAFVDVLAGPDNALRPYQVPFARRIIESLLYEDAASLTALFSRQSGKTESVANTVAALMILLPRLAKIFPDHPVLSKFKRGFRVGFFAPTDNQSEILFSRLIDRLTSDHAFEILSDPEIDDKADGKSSRIRLVKCGSFATRTTANPRAKIEGSTYHLVVIDEAQDCDDQAVRKSVMPMLTETAGTSVRTGTPNRYKGDFYKQIQINKRNRVNKKGSPQNHFEADWKEVAKYSRRYLKTALSNMEAWGEDSDEFQMSYALRWLLDRGMFTTETKFDELGDIRQQELVKTWPHTPVVVGIDVARSHDSTVVTVVHVDWDRPDAMGHYEHRVLNWLDLQGVEFEAQYYEIVRFLEPYNIFAVGIDAQGMGQAVAERLAILLRHKMCEVIPMPSHAAEQTKRWSHLQTLMDRKLLSWPAGAKVRRLRTWKRFQEQMLNAEKHFQGPNIRIEAPDEPGAFDDYVDSLALACYCSASMSVPEVEVIESPFYSGGRRRGRAG